MHQISDQDSTGNDLSRPDKTIIAKRIATNDAEKVLKPMCPESREGPILVCCENALYQYEPTVQNPRPRGIGANVKALAF
jgi:hypothetical protein